MDNSSHKRFRLALNLEPQNIYTVGIQNRRGPTSTKYYQLDLITNNHGGKWGGLRDQSFYLMYLCNTYSLTNPYLTQSLLHYDLSLIKLSPTDFIQDTKTTVSRHKYFFNRLTERRNPYVLTPIIFHVKQRERFSFFLFPKKFVTAGT